MNGPFAVMSVFHEYTSRTDEEGDSVITALRCLAYYLHTKSKKKVNVDAKVDIPFLLNEVPVRYLHE